MVTQVKQTDTRARLEAAGTMGRVRVLDYEPWVSELSRRVKTERGWGEVVNPYMGVDGRIRMAVDDHLAQGGKMDFGDIRVLSDTDEELTLMVTIESSIYGRRHGIATSKRVNGPPIEAQHPYEIAETSAIGRALANMGYGLIPGSGVASAEDMDRAAQDAPEGKQGKPAPEAQSKHRLTDRQVDWLIESAAIAGHDNPEQWLRAWVAHHENMDLEQLGSARAREIGQSLRDSVKDKALQSDAAQEPAKGGDGEERQPEPGDYLKDSDIRRRTIATLEANKLVQDALATVSKWTEEGYTEQRTKAALTQLFHSRWRRRFFAAIKELGLTEEQAKATLEIDSLTEVYDEPVETVLATLKELSAA